MKNKNLLLMSLLCFGTLSLTACNTGEISSNSSIADSESVIDPCYYTEGLQFVLSDDGESYSISGYTGTESNVIIPSVYEDKPVTSIEMLAFSLCSTMKSIKIPDSITTINLMAFSHCEALESIIVDKNNSVYDSRDNCNAIIETSTNTLIAGCKSTVIPDSVTGIGNTAFMGCWSLTSITIPNSVTNIGNRVFQNCSSLTSITIPDSVTSIDAEAFSGCSSLESITLPNSLTNIGGYTFSSCSSLTSITIPDSVTSIGSFAFQGCSSLTSITIPDSVTSIDSYAFKDCSSLTSITIHDNVTSIELGAFYQCNSLTEVYYTGTQEQWNAIYISIYNVALTSATIHYNYVPEE